MSEDIPPLSNFKQHCKTNTVMHLERMLRLIRLNAPETIIANEVTAMFKTIEGWLSDTLYGLLNQERQSAIRTYCGYCSHTSCDNRTGPPFPNTKPLCSKCESWMEEEGKRLEAEAAEITEEAKQVSEDDYHRRDPDLEI